MTLGLVLLMLEAFATGGDKRFVGHLAIAGLGRRPRRRCFFVEPYAGQRPSFWKFYTADSLAMTYKAIALLTTLLVLILGLGLHPGP